MLTRFLPTPSDYPAEQHVPLRANIRMHLFDGSLYVLGMSIVSVQTILPVFIKELGGSPIAIGSVQVLWTIGQNLPSMFVAHYLQRRILFKSPMVGWGLAHRLMLLVCAVAAYFLIETLSSRISVPLFLFLIFLIPAIGSLSGLPWFQVFTKTIPVQLRGRLMGIRQLLGSAGGAIGGSIISLVLYAVVFPANYALLFLIAFIITMFSFYFLTRISELPSLSEGRELPRTKILSEARRIIVGDRNFRNFLFADLFILMSLAASSFYSVYAIEKFSLPPSYAGTFTAIVMITNIAANIVFGIVGDSYGHKMNLMAFALSSALAALFAVISTNILMYGLVFVFLACATQIQSISRLSFIAEMCSEKERPVYVGIVNTLTAPTVFIGLLFGWMIPMTGFAVIFVTAALLAVNSFLILYNVVHEPRKFEK
ncbi:MAG: MFS transporter [Bacteriovoracaceae bacterium]|nr:MFS transporter [Bacteroidota bacterium]